jgi:hypothetical protein
MMNDDAAAGPWIAMHLHHVIIMIMIVVVVVIMIIMMMIQLCVFHGLLAVASSPNP